MISLFFVEMNKPTDESVTESRDALEVFSVSLSHYATDHMRTMYLNMLRHHLVFVRKGSLRRGY